MIRILVLQPLIHIISKGEHHHHQWVNPQRQVRERQYKEEQQPGPNQNPNHNPNHLKVRHHQKFL